MLKKGFIGENQGEKPENQGKTRVKKRVNQLNRVI